MEDKVFETFDEFYEEVWRRLQTIIPKEHYEIARKFMNEEREEAEKDFNAGENRLSDVCESVYAYSLGY